MKKLAFVVLAACGSSKSGKIPTDLPAPAPAPEPAPAPAPPVETKPEPPPAPAAIQIDVDAQGLAWDAEHQRLVIADARGNRLASWTKTDGVATIVALPALGPDEKQSLGQPVAIGGGAWLVPKFGFGKTGAIYKVGADNKVAPLPGLDPARRRIGLTVDTAQTPYDTWFVKEKAGGTAGVSMIQGGKELDFVKTLKKPVGVVAIGTQLVVVDQEAGALLSIALTDKTHTPKAFAYLPSPDLIVEGPTGTVLVTQRSGGLAEVALADGKLVQLTTDRDETRGLAYDAKSRTAYVAIRPTAKDGPTEIRLVAVP